MSRRAFLRAAGLAGGALLLGTAPRALASAPPAAEALRVGLIVPATPEGEAAARGATLGAEEAARAAELLGRSFDLVGASGGDAAAVAEAGERLLREEGVFALVGGFDEATVLALAGVAARHGCLLVNVGATADALRGEACRREVFHVAASEAMQRDALAHWRAGEAASAATGAERVALWHPELERFGAGQLNDRYQARFARPMEPLAWAGWMAVKTLWEAAARSRATGAPELVRFLESGRARFDGHKGTQLSFRPWDHQLRQPLYIVRPQSASTVVVGEVPGPARGEESPHERLDRLGTGESESRCTGNPSSPPKERT